ncbi:MAG TPA: ABC transporter permease [Polyangiaceae bacterium]|nr:ABC transporter permease [Polyangiaceae bacterium]
MGFPLDLAVRYMGSKKRTFISMGTFFAIIGVALGVAGLATAMSVTGGFRRQFRDKVLGVNAHVLVLKRSSYFGEYRELIGKLKDVPGVTGIAPFTINPMMVTKGDRTATGVLLKGVEPAKVGDVLDLPQHIVQGSLAGLRLPGAKPAEGKRSSSYVVDKRERTATNEGGNDSFLAELSRVVKEEAEAQKAGHPAAATDGEPALAEGAPVGSIVPEGGYKSVLPDDDILPEDMTRDPCAVGSEALPGVVIGITLSKNLRAGLGDCIQVTSPTIGFSFANDVVRAPVAKQFRVIAIFDAGFDQYDAKLVYTDLYEAQQFADAGDSVTGIEMKVADVDDAGSVARHIDEMLGDGLHYTMDWEELNRGLFTALRIQQILMSLVLALIIVVASFTVIATLIMIVLDKKKEIAVLKAMGATDSAILRAFLYQGGIIGLVGGVAGLGLATAVCKLLVTYLIPLDPKVYFISRVPVDAHPGDFALVGVFAVLVCVIATLGPALHAARLRPVEAFREQ